MIFILFYECDISLSGCYILGLFDVNIFRVIVDNYFG